MNPELKPDLQQLLAHLESLREQNNTFLEQVIANHPDGVKLADAATHIGAAITSLRAIGFGLETDFSYDD